MLYADGYCTYTEVKDTYIFTGTCKTCKQKVSVTVPAQGLYKYRQGALIQEAFPFVPTADREFLMSGICGVCFDEMFSEDEE